MDDLRKNRLKHITGIIVPLLVVIITVVVVGSSFAWYSDSATAEIATINLSTAKAFTLQFELDTTTATQPTNKSYNGQTSVSGIVADASGNFPVGANGGYLVTDERAASNSLTSNLNYTHDKAYEYMAMIKIDTDSETIDLDVYFSALQIAFMDGNSIITTSPSIIIPSTTDGTTYGINDINYGFTWYFYKIGTESVIYAPYGEVGENNSPTLTNKWTTTPTKQSIPNFSAVSTDRYMFVIVFAPEKLYWLQYSQHDEDGTGTSYVPDYQKPVNDVYTSTERASNAYAYARGYTSQGFKGALFSFTVTFERA